MQVSTKNTRTLTITDIGEVGQIIAAFDTNPDAGGRVTLIANGKTFSQFWVNVGAGRTTEEKFVNTAAETLLSGFDPFGTLRLKIDPQVAMTQITDIVKSRHESGEFDEKEVDQLLAMVGNLVPISNANGLQPLANDLLVKLWGPNWHPIAERELLGKHPEYLALQQYIALVVEALDPK